MIGGALRRWLVAPLLGVAALGACGGSSEPARPVARRQPVELRRIAEDAPAPPFRVLTTAGDVLDSADLLGRRPLVLVFFTTWCPVCDRKLPLVREVLAGFGDDLTAVAVSLDDVETWPRVPEYLERHQISLPVVRGALHARFVLSYDPSLGIPLVVVVGRDGKVVDVQSGWAHDDPARLRAAVEVARLLPASAPAVGGGAPPGPPAPPPAGGPPGPETR